MNAVNPQEVASALILSCSTKRAGPQPVSLSIGILWPPDQTKKLRIFLTKHSVSHPFRLRVQGEEDFTMPGTEEECAPHSKSYKRAMFQSIYEREIEGEDEEPEDSEVDGVQSFTCAVRGR